MTPIQTADAAKGIAMALASVSQMPEAMARQLANEAKAKGEASRKDAAAALGTADCPCEWHEPCAACEARIKAQEEARRASYSGSLTEEDPRHEWNAVYMIGQTGRAA